MLRRGLLKDHQTVNSLLDGHEYSIRVSEAGKKLPVFLAANARGNGLELAKPAASGSLSNYLSLRTKEAGYGEHVTMFSFRRRAGTVVQRHAGTSVTQRYMDHQQGSFTYDQHYEQGLYDYDVFAVTMGESPATEDVRKQSTQRERNGRVLTAVGRNLDVSGTWSITLRARLTQPGASHTTISSGRTDGTVWTG